MYTDFCPAVMCVGWPRLWCAKETCINAKIVVWEHVRGVFLLRFNIFDVFLLLEVVWDFVLLLCTLFFDRQSCVLAGHVCGAQKVLLVLNIFDACMLLEVVWNFILLLCTLFFVRQLCMLPGHVCGA